MRTEAPSGALSPGDFGPRVTALQSALIERGLLDDSADGRFGWNTAVAIIDLKFLLGMLDPDEPVEDFTASIEVLHSLGLD